MAAVLAAVVVASLLGRPSSEAGAQEAPRSDVAVSPKAPPTFAYQQPSMAFDPARPGHAALSYEEGSQLEACYLSRSTDGGVTWRSEALVGTGGRYPHREGATKCWNPKLAYGPEGTLYYAVQDRWPNDGTGAHVLLYVSDDGGTTFRTPVEVDPVATSIGTGWWPDLGVDQASGRVYLAWSRRQSTFPIPATVFVSSSSDRGLTFSPPVPVSPVSQPITSGPLVAVGRTGTLYVSYLDHTKWFGSRAEQPAELHVAASDDGGGTFRDSGVIDTVAPGCVLAAAGPFNCDAKHGNGPWQVNAIAAGASPGEVFAAWWDARGDGGRSRISFSSSSDGARSWAPPQVVGVKAGEEDHDQLRPWLSVAPNGRLDIAFYDQGPGFAQRVHLISSNDGGRSFSAPRLLNDASSDASVGPPSFFPTPGGSEVRWGDFLALVSSDRAVSAAWTDNRRGCYDTGHQDIYFTTAEPSANPLGPRTVSGAGYWLVTAEAKLLDFGDASFCGEPGRAPGRHIVAIVATATRRGYWMVTAEGEVLAFGDAVALGSARTATLNAPMVAMAATPSGLGYWLAASDGGVFAFGDARFLGSLGGTRLNGRLVGMAASPTGKGYWLVASDGGVFAFGDARFHGSTGAMRLNRQVVAMAAAPSGDGYWLTASDGGVFAFGAARFHGSTGALRLNRPVVAMAPAPAGGGYWLLAEDGGVFAFGAAKFHGPPAGNAPTLGYIGIAGF